MEIALQIYSLIVSEYLNKKFKGEEHIDPKELNREQCAVKNLFIPTVLFTIYGNKKFLKQNGIIREVDNWLKNEFHSRNFFSEHIDHSNKLLVEVAEKHLYSLETIKKDDTLILYEKLLGVEISLTRDITEAQPAKNYRNKLGSYYTPKELAYEVTVKTLDKYFEQNLQIEELSKVNFLEDIPSFLEEIKSLRFADFSCGSGVFLVQIIKFFKRIFATLGIEKNLQQNTLNQIAINIYGFDVDPIALEIAKMNLLVEGNLQHSYEEVSKNFVHGNFLLQESSATKAKKEEIFFKGYIYHEDLGIDKKKLPLFDIILGNPPWEKIRFEEKKFYAMYESSISKNHFKSDRKDEISSQENQKLFEFAEDYKSRVNANKKMIKKDPFFSKSSGGELNTYALFTEASTKLRKDKGIAGLILKSAVVTSQINRLLFKFLVQENLILSVHDFVNRKKIFDIDSRERFCILFLGRSKENGFLVSMNYKSIEDLRGDESLIKLNLEDLSVINPTSLMLPNFDNVQQANFILRLSKEFPYFEDIYKSAKFGRIVHFTSHSDFISRKESINNLPIYEGKFFHQFDGKYAGFNGMSDKAKYGNKSMGRVLTTLEKNKSNFFPESRFYIENEKWKQLSKKYIAEYMLAWRSLTSATNSRTTISTILPFFPASQSVQFLIDDTENLIILSGLFNSIVFDFIVKKKLSGIDLTQSLLKQVPVPNKQDYHQTINLLNKEESIQYHINQAVSHLLGNDARLKPILSQNSKEYEELSSLEVRKYLDLIFIYLYRLNKSEIDLVLSLFGKEYSHDDREWFKENINRLYAIP